MLYRLKLKKVFKMLVTIFMFGVYASFVTGLIKDLIRINQGHYDNKEFNILSFKTVGTLCLSWVGTTQNLLEIKHLMDSKKVSC